jgi:hypothetical protein
MKAMKDIKDVFTAGSLPYFGTGLAAAQFRKCATGLRSMTYADSTANCGNGGINKKIPDERLL